MKTIVFKIRLVEFQRKFALICIIFMVISIFPAQGKSYERVNRTGKSKPELSVLKSSTYSEIQIEEEIEVEPWMLCPKHTSWFVTGEEGLNLAKWMIDIHAENWVAGNVQETIPELQNWMLTPSEWLH